MAETKKNTRNPQSLLFRRLTRLLSGPLTNYRSQGNHKLRRIDLDKFASRFSSASGSNFKKTAYSPYDNLQANVMAGLQRAERYVDFDQMEYTPEIASALDIYADEMTTHSAVKPLLAIDCHNEEIKSILDALYFNVLNIEYNLFSWCRSMCKYGDFFLYLDIDEKTGIHSTIGLPAAEVERLEGEDPTNPNYVQFQWNSAGLTFENWQMGHFRILGNDKYNPYGTSTLEPARRIWRQLTLLEDAMMAYRIVRSPERRVFKIDVGNIPPQDVEQYMQKVMSQMKRHQVLDTDTGRVDLRYNPLSVDEDYFIPVRGDTKTEITTLAGGAYTGDIDDVKYLRDKLFSALKVPASYLSRGEEGGEEDKGTLAQKDIRFARTIQRLQRSVITELEKIGIVHLYVLGYREEDLIGFKIHLNNPSKIAELQELEHWKSKFDIASSATEGFFSKRWLAKKLFGMSEEEFIRNRREMFYDRRFEASLEALAEMEQAAMSPDTGGAGGMDMGGALEGEPGGMGTVGTEAELGAPTEELGGAEGGLPEPEAEGDLLAAPPATRRDGKTTTPRSHGFYEPRGLKGGDRRKGPGPLKKRMKAAGAMEKARHTMRNILPGASELLGLGRGIYEEDTTSYLEREQENILRNTAEIKLLFESLKLRNKSETEEKK